MPAGARHVFVVEGRGPIIRIMATAYEHSICTLHFTGNSTQSKIMSVTISVYAYIVAPFYLFGKMLGVFSVFLVLF
jgi:hypothetical protein